MSAKEPSPHRQWVEKPSGSEMRVNVLNGTLVARELEVELADVVLKAADPANLLCMAPTSCGHHLT